MSNHFNTRHFLLRVWQVLTAMVMVSISPHLALAKDLDHGSLSVYSRGEGWYQDGREVKPTHSRILDLNKIKLTQTHLLDSQYRQKRHYQGIFIQSLMAGLSHEPKADTLLLHFKNQMTIPVPLAALTKHPQELFLALAIQNTKGTWQKSFPRLRKPNILLKDPRPLTFSGNKIVVQKPGNLISSPGGFNPFRFADSLVAIEFVRDQAYLEQFHVGSPEGLQVYARRCRYCHGVRQIGAGYGWDFVSPLPIYEKRNAQSLLFHVKYEKNEALENGLMMPTQKDIQPQEAKDLWQWLQDSATHKQKPYRL